MTAFHSGEAGEQPNDNDVIDIDSGANEDEDDDDEDGGGGLRRRLTEESGAAAAGEEDESGRSSDERSALGPYDADGGGGQERPAADVDADGFRRPVNEAASASTAGGLSCVDWLKFPTSSVLIFCSMSVL